MGGAMGVWATFLLMLIVGGSCLAAPPSPTGTKRSDENIQFGNQQNKPVSVLDEDALPGAFPSSETTENGEPDKPTADPEEEPNKDEDDGQLQEPPSAASSPEDHHHLQSVSQHLNLHHPQPPHHREEMVRDLPPVALASQWGPPSELYNPHWRMPISPMYGGGGGDDGTFPSRRRRRRSIDHDNPTPDPSKILQVSLHALRTGHRHKRDVSDIRRIRRDLSNNIDFEKLRREVDLVELLAMLAKPPSPPHRNPGFATVTYAPLAPLQPRFAPQPKLFPDNEEEEEEEEEEEDEDLGVSLLRQNVRPTPPQPENVLYPSNRVWRRSGSYGLYAMPGFKRSAFRANTPPPPPPPPVRTLTPGDVYSLAAMLGAELDPVTHRMRRAVM